jgi:hypothetical protein
MKKSHRRSAPANCERGMEYLPRQLTCPQTLSLEAAMNHGMKLAFRDYLTCRTLRIRKKLHLRT